MSDLFTLDEMLQITGGELVQGSHAASIENVVIDSRQATRGTLFVALPGEQTDGHRYVADAASGGAAAALVTEWPVAPSPPAGFCVVRVDDGADALAALASHHRERFPELTVIGITGSVGKTTVKDMIAGVLDQTACVLKTYANWNTELGVPLMVLRLRPEHRYAVLELAMRGLNQIRLLARVARPSIGVITNIQDTHMELLGSQENIARAKAELLEELPADGVAVLNADDEWVQRVAGSADCRRTWFGVRRADVDYRVSVVAQHQKSVELRVDGPGTATRVLELPVPGAHNAYNVAAAAAVCRELGVEWRQLVAGLESVELTGMRMQVLELGSVTVLNDAYNANVHSTQAALSAFEALAAERRRIIILGDMLELGPREEQAHREIGQAVAELGPALFVAVGPRMKWAVSEALRKGYPRPGAIECTDSEEASHVVPDLVKAGDAVLIKGSRGVALEKVFRALEERTAQAAE